MLHAVAAGRRTRSSSQLRTIVQPTHVQYRTVEKCRTAEERSRRRAVVAKRDETERIGTNETRNRIHASDDSAHRIASQRAELLAGALSKRRGALPGCAHYTSYCIKYSMYSTHLYCPHARYSMLYVYAVQIVLLPVCTTRVLYSILECGVLCCTLTRRTRRISALLLYYWMDRSRTEASRRRSEDITHAQRGAALPSAQNK